MFSSRRRHTRWNCDWSSDVCSSDLFRDDRSGGVKKFYHIRERWCGHIKIRILDIRDDVIYTDTHWEYLGPQNGNIFCTTGADECTRSTTVDTEFILVSFSIITTRSDAMQEPVRQNNEEGKR